MNNIENLLNLLRYEKLSTDIQRMRSIQPAYLIYIQRTVNSNEKLGFASSTIIQLRSGPTINPYESNSQKKDLPSDELVYDLIYDKLHHASKSILEKIKWLFSLVNIQTNCPYFSELEKEHFIQKFSIMFDVGDQADLCIFIENELIARRKLINTRSKNE